MSVKRIVPNISTEDTVPVDRFYGDMLRMQIVMDQGWVVTYASASNPTAQVNVLTDDMTAPMVPDMSIEVENVERVYRRAQEMGFEIVYPLTQEPWGLQRFFVRDPFGKIVNVSEHA